LFRCGRSLYRRRIAYFGATTTSDRERPSKRQDRDLTQGKQIPNLSEMVYYHPTPTWRGARASWTRLSVPPHGASANFATDGTSPTSKRLLPFLRARGSIAVLRRESATVRLYLERAAAASERASTATDPTMRRFHLAMESKWMDLAASTAFVERVDLFLHTREFRLRLSPSDLCPDCHDRMLLIAIRTTAEFDAHTFRCRKCGFEHTRRFRGDGSPIS
jgi:hypothetical protein